MGIVVGVVILAMIMVAIRVGIACTRGNRTVEPEPTPGETEPSDNNKKSTDRCLHVIRIWTNITNTCSNISENFESDSQ